jgi:uncharacterized protein YqgC (DUF456 family)
MHRFRTISGIGLLILGGLGLILPVIPGLVFIAAGVAVLGADHIIVRTGRDRIAPVIRRVRGWLERKGYVRPKPE